MTTATTPPKPPQAPPTSEVWTTKEVGLFLRLSPPTLRVWFDRAMAAGYEPMATNHHLAEAIRQVARKLSGM